jgi:large subunit ribosomal protein L17
MRHRVAGRKLSRPTEHRELMFRNMLVSLLQYERIQTTLAKAKELRSYADKIITLGKKDSLHARRQAFSLLRNRDMVKKLFEEIVPKFKDTEGGYTRIYQTKWRHGDGAPLSLIELTTYAPPAEKKKSAVKKAIDKVSAKKTKKDQKKGKSTGGEAPETPSRRSRKKGTEPEGE